MLSNRPPYERPAKRWTVCLSELLTLRRVNVQSVVDGPRVTLVRNESVTGCDVDMGDLNAGRDVQ
jgi:hypothetical protein